MHQHIKDSSYDAFQMVLIDFRTFIEANEFFIATQKDKKIEIQCTKDIPDDIIRKYQVITLTLYVVLDSSHKAEAVVSIKLGKYLGRFVNCISFTKHCMKMI